MARAFADHGGFGLVLTKKLSQILGGDFWLESSVLGQGSCFVAEVRVEVPRDAFWVQSARFQYSTSKTKALSADQNALFGKKILVVEDSPDNQMLLKVLLKRFGADMTFADDGQAGSGLALCKDYDLVLMDVQMPVMDGYQAVRYLREKGYQRPIVALTAHAMNEERDRCLAAGYTDFLSKPIDRVKLLETIQLNLRPDDLN